LVKRHRKINSHSRMRKREPIKIKEGGTSGGDAVSGPLRDTFWGFVRRKRGCGRKKARRKMEEPAGKGLSKRDS